MASTDARAFPTKNTAYRVTFPIFDADGDLVTGATGLDSEVSKDGGTFADCTNEATEIATSSGMYYLDLTSTEMNADTVAIIVKTSSSGAKTTPMVFYPATLSVAQLGVNMVQVGGTVQTAGDIPALINTVDDFLDTEIAAILADTNELQTDLVNGGRLDLLIDGIKAKTDLIPASPAAVGDIPTAAAIADAVLDEDMTAHQTQGTLGQAIGDPVADTDTIWALVNTNLNATVSSRASQTSVDTIDDFLDTEVAAILADTNELQTDLVNGGRLDLLIDGIKAKTDLIPASPAATGDIPTAAAIADAVLDEDMTAHQTQGTLGQAIGDPVADTDTIWGLVNTNLNATVSSRASQTSVDTIDDFLDTEVAAILADTNELQTDLVNGGRLDLLIDGIKTKTDLIPASPAAVGDIPSAATIADAVWDEATAGHVGAGSTGAALSAATAPSAAAVADAVWDEALSGHLGAGSTGEALNAAGAAGDPWTTTIPGAYGAGSAGYILGNNVNATISSRASQTSVDTIDDFLDTEVAAILADTNELQTDLVNGGRLDLLIDGIKAKTDLIPASPAATGDIPTAAAIADAVLDEDMTAHQTQGTLGQAIGDPVADSDTIWALVNTNLNATVSSRASQTSVDTIDDFLDTEVAAILADTNELQTDLVNGGRLDLLIDGIKAKTDNLPTDPADQSAVEVAITAATSGLATAAALDAVDNFVDTEIAAIKAKTDLIPASPAAVGDIPTAAQNADAVWDEATVEVSQGIPPATPTFRQAVMYLYMALRNRVDVVATFKKFYNDAGTVIWKKALADDGTTYTESEGETGP